MMSRSFTFSHAITRVPAESAISGLRAVDVGAPDINLFLEHHKTYVEMLRSTGAEVIELQSLHEFPDSCFVEDAALCLQEGAVIMRPGAPSRLGEAEQMRPELEKLYNTVLKIEGPGFIEGGDILTTEKEILVGTSARTDDAGIEELRALVSPWGYAVRKVETPPGVLHFKTDCSLLDGETILSTKRLSASGCFNGYRVLHVADGEEPVANSIRFNNIVMMPDGHPKTAELLDREGYKVVLMGNSEAAKLDGGLSCLSLRFSPNGNR